jgi:hypothetical protein
MPAGFCQLQSTPAQPCDCYRGVGRIDQPAGPQAEILMASKSARRIAVYALLFIVYLVSTVPIGLFLYSLKTKVGINIFGRGGFHAYLQCLNTSFPMNGGRVGQATRQEPPKPN